MRALRNALAAVLLLPGLGCAWVSLDDRGAEVSVVSNAEVADCERVGNTRASVLHEVWFVPRRQAAVDRELAILARNAGAELEGNTVTPLPARSPGERDFAVYRCDD